MSFPARLLDLRQKKELTQNQLAELVNISRSALSLYELGKREPDFETLQKLANFFDVSVDYLLGRTDTKKFDLNIDNIAAMRSREIEGYKDYTKDEQDFLREFVKEYYERFGKKKGE